MRQRGNELGWLREEDVLLHVSVPSISWRLRHLGSALWACPVCVIARTENVNYAPINESTAHMNGEYKAPPTATHPPFSLYDQQIRSTDQINRSDQQIRKTARTKNLVAAARRRTNGPEGPQAPRELFFKSRALESSSLRARALESSSLRARPLESSSLRARPLESSSLRAGP